MNSVRAAVFEILISVLCTVCLAGCTQITVLSDQTSPKTEWKFGVLAIDVAGSQKNTIVVTKGIGLITTPDSATLGYANAKFVRMGDECRLVIATSDPAAIEQREELLRLLRTIPTACGA